MVENDTDSIWSQLAHFLNANCTSSSSSLENVSYITTTPAIPDHESAMHNGLFHFAHACFLLSYLSPNSRYGQISLHCGLAIGFLVISTWAWNVICAPDVFAWYFGFTILNVGQLLYILYQMRPIRFDNDLESIYSELFEPMSITRLQFKRLVSGSSAAAKAVASVPGATSTGGSQIVTLHSGECYAIQDMTRTDRLAMCIAGRVNVLTERTFLHSIHPGEFLDSPEFESSGPRWADSTATESAFKVTICAAVPSRCIVWPRAVLEYLFVKDPHLAVVMTTLISRDITHKLLNMNAKLKTKDGNPLDLRLPGIAGRLKEMDARELAKFTALANNNEEQHRRKATERQKRGRGKLARSPIYSPPSKFGTNLA